MIFIISGISGAGKGSVSKVFEEYDIPRAISHTTRPLRDYEVNGEHYHFTTKEDTNFEDMPAHDYHRSHWYGTSRKEFAKADHVFCEMSLKGMQDLTEYYGEDNVCTIWIYAPLNHAQYRLIARDGLEQAVPRIEGNKEEYDNIDYYSHHIRNSNCMLEQSKDKLRAIIEEVI